MCTCISYGLAFPRKPLIQIVENKRMIRFSKVQPGSGLITSPLLTRSSNAITRKGSVQRLRFYPLTIAGINRRIVHVSASRNEKANDAENSYSKELQVREAELWRRQSELLDDLRAQLAEERSYWQAQDAAYKQELTELRAQLLYALKMMDSKSLGTHQRTEEAEGGLLEQPAPEKPRKQETSAQLKQVDKDSPLESYDLPQQAKAAKSTLAEELAAAFAAPDTTDVLQEIDFSPKPPPESSFIVEAPLEAEIFPAGPPPTLSLGDDDIFWVSQLHTALANKGFYAGDDDVENFFFTDGTLSALLTFQACEGLPENGITDEATWIALLGPSLKPLPADKNITAYPDSDEDADSAPVPLLTNSSPARPNEENRFSSFESNVSTAMHSNGFFVSERIEVREEVVMETWPVLMEGDGGREVHALHVALQEHGYYPGEDDVRWWTYGDSTLTALKTFQACQGLAESGVADAVVWQKLLGPGAVPSDIRSMKSGESDDDDLADDGDGERVWLLGEQRWERIRKG